MNTFETFFKNKSVLITGGAGFVGSNLAHYLVKMGANVSVLDNFHPSFGSNRANFKGIEGAVKIYEGDVANTNTELLDRLVSESDIVIHAAAQCSHVDSMIDPWLDLNFNCEGTLRVLEAAKKAKANGKKTSIVYVGTRAMLGAPLTLPADERTLPNPVDIYGVNKLAAELYGSVYARVHQVPFVSLRMTNSYGPRHQMKHGRYGILNWFISLAMQKKTIKVFGTGEQLRDYLYIDDAVECILRAAMYASTAVWGEGNSSGDVRYYKQAHLAGENIPFAVYNMGSGKGLKFVDCAKMVVEIAGGQLEMVEWPADRKAIETGDYVSDGVAALRGLGWQSSTTFADGLQKTHAFYLNSLNDYL